MRNANRADKDNLSIGIYILIFVAVIAVFYWYFRNTNFVLAVLPLAFIFQQFIILPKVNKLYSKMCGEETSAVMRYIPVLNETSIFTTFYSNLNIVLGAIQIVLLAIVCGLWMDESLTAVMEMVFGASFAMNAVFNLTVWLLVFYIIGNITRGLGYFHVKREIDWQHSKFSETPSGKVAYTPFDNIMYLFYFFPLFRTMALAYSLNRLTKIVELHDLKELNHNDFIEERIY